MTYQEILEGITRHRADRLINGEPLGGLPTDLVRKIDQIEWALQALAEKGRDAEQT